MITLINQHIKLSICRTDQQYFLHPSLQYYWLFVMHIVLCLIHHLYFAPKRIWLDLTWINMKMNMNISPWIPVIITSVQGVQGHSIHKCLAYHTYNKMRLKTWNGVLFSTKCIECFAKFDIQNDTHCFCAYTCRITICQAECDYCCIFSLTNKHNITYSWGNLISRRPRYVDPQSTTNMHTVHLCCILLCSYYISEAYDITIQRYSRPHTKIRLSKMLILQCKVTKKCLTF